MKSDKYGNFTIRKIFWKLWKVFIIKSGNEDIKAKNAMILSGLNLGVLHFLNIIYYKIRRQLISVKNNRLILAGYFLGIQFQKE